MGSALCWAPTNVNHILFTQQHSNITPILQMMKFRTKEVKEHSWGSQPGQGRVRIPTLIHGEVTLGDLTYPIFSITPLPSSIDALCMVKRYSCYNKREPWLPPRRTPHSKPSSVRILEPPQCSISGVPYCNGQAPFQVVLDLTFIGEELKTWLTEVPSSDIPWWLGSRVCSAVSDPVAS